VVTWSKRAWARSSSCKPLDAERGLKSIVRISQHAEDLDNTPLEGQGGEETGEQEGEGSKAESRRVWAAGWDTSMNKACALVVTRTHIGEALLGTLRGPNERGRGLRAVSLWTPNEASDLSYVPLSMRRTLMIRPWRGRGVEETGE